MATSLVAPTRESTSGQHSSETKQPSQQITLIDHTIPSTPTDPNRDPTETEHGADDLASHSPAEATITRRWTKQSLHKQLTERKYARYQEHRLIERDEDPSQNQEGELRPEEGRFQRGKGRVKGLLKRRKMRQTQEEDAAIDVLYENQRGLFTIGIPHFSSKSLLNFDPKPWTNAHKRTSPVNITNAQVPDPNWEWAWKSWYVDMSRDVDEDGWEYSLAFTGCAWHGNHPWFHSFVRRRRWLRKRVRKHAHHIQGRAAGQKHMSEAHMLTPEYFTIHSSRTRSMDESRTPSIAASSGGKLRSQSDDDEHKEQFDIQDIASLLVYMKRAAIDREKLVLVRNFVKNADDELYYLSDQMSHIMSIFVFQNSRRQLLEILMDEINKASAHREEHVASSTDESATEKSRIDYLLKAVQAADDEVKRLEYWSDIRKMARDGKTGNAVDGTDKWPARDWQGLDSSGPGSSGGMEAKEEGQSREEVKREAEEIGRKLTSGEKGTEEESSDAYTTAEERPRDFSKGKGRAD